MSCIQIDGAEVRVTANNFIKHDGYLHRVDTLMKMLHLHREEISGKKIIFQFPDGEPISFTALDRILEIICINHKLTADQVVCRMIDHHPRFRSDWCSVETHPTPFFQQTADLLQADLCLLDPGAVLFGAAYGRFTPARLLMAHFLSTRFRDDSFVIFQPSRDTVEFEMAPGGQLFQDAIDWSATRIDHRDLECQFNGCVSSTACLPIYHKIFSRYRIEVVIETNTFSQGWFTEKTAKCLASGKPFLLYGTSGQLQRLRKLGFRTFENCLNESYDSEQDPDIRFDMLCDTALCIHNHPQLCDLLDELDAIAQWNRQNYDRIIKDYYHDYSD